MSGSESDAIDVRVAAGQAGDTPVGKKMIDAMSPCDRITQAAIDQAHLTATLSRAKLAAKGVEPIIPAAANSPRLPCL